MVPSNLCNPSVEILSSEAIVNRFAIIKPIHLRWAILLVVASAINCADSSCANAQFIEPVAIPTNESQRVEYWLDRAWKKSLDNRNRSLELYELAPVRDATVMIAYAINRLHHNQARAAGEVITAALKIAPDNLDAQLLDVWIKTLRDDYDGGLSRMRSFAKSLAKRKLPPVQLEATYRRIGRLLGYFKGPVGELINQDILRATVKELSVGASPNQKQIMNEEANKVITDYKERLAGLDKKIEQSVAEKKVSNEANRKAIEQENNLLQTQAQKIQDQKADVRNEGEEKIAAATSRVLPLQNQLRSLETDINVVQNQIRSLQTSLFFHQNDPNGSLFLYDALRYQIQDKYFVLGNLGDQADAVAFELNRAGVQVAQIRNQYGGALTQIERDLKNTAKREKVNSKRLGKLAAPPKPNSNKVSSLTNKLTALNSYDQLPLELYRTDLIDATR